MTDKELSVTLRASAVEHGLCDEWRNEWKGNSTPQELINKYLRGVDFALANHWPSNDFIKENFNKDILIKNNIIVDMKRSVLNPRICVVLGSSEVNIRLNSQHPSVIYIRDNANVTIYVHCNEKIIVHTFENASIKVIPGEIYTPDVLILKHSKNTTVDVPVSVEVVEDFDYLKD